MTTPINVSQRPAPTLAPEVPKVALEVSQGALEGGAAEVVSGLELKSMSKRSTDAIQVSLAKVQKDFDGAFSIIEEKGTGARRVEEYLPAFKDLRGDIAVQRRLLLAESNKLKSLDSAVDSPRSAGGMIDDLLALIDLIDTEYLAVYEALMEKYGEFFKEFNDIIAKLGQWTSMDGDKVKLEVAELRTHMSALFHKYANAPGVILYPTSKEEAEKWAAALGGVAEEYVPGHWVVKMDVSKLQAISGLIPGPTDVTYTFDNELEYNAWLTGFNTAKSEFENTLQLISTKYNNANGYHENFNKLLSAQISQLGEMLKAYANSL